jgi:alpha/beta superfamily hydrolase
MAAPADTSSESFILPGIPGEPPIEGLWMGAGPRVAVVAPPHPLLGGHFSNPVVQAVADGFVAAGLRVLLFNYRGVGESGGEPSGDPEHGERDFAAALAVAALSAAPVLAAGYSFGGVAALRTAARDTRVGAALAVAPPAPMLAGTDLARLGAGLRVVAGEKDRFAPPVALEPVARAVRGARFDVVASADHFFARGPDEIRRIARESGSSFLSVGRQE